jgi:hypothetical protein
MNFFSNYYFAYCYDSVSGIKNKVTLLKPNNVFTTRNLNVTILNDGDAIFVLGLVALKTGGYQCIVCARQFSILHNGKRHFENVHENVDRRVACYICQAVYKNSSVLENHLRKAHGIYRSNWKKTSWTKKLNA